MYRTHTSNSNQFTEDMKSFAVANANDCIDMWYVTPDMQMQQSKQLPLLLLIQSKRSMAFCRQIFFTFQWFNSHRWQFYMCFCTDRTTNRLVLCLEYVKLTQVMKRQKVYAKRTSNDWNGLCSGRWMTSISVRFKRSWLFIRKITANAMEMGF